MAKRATFSDVAFFVYLCLKNKSMVSIITSLLIKYSQVLITTGVSIAIRALEKNAIVKKYQSQISGLVKDLKDASQNSK